MGKVFSPENADVVEQAQEIKNPEGSMEAFVKCEEEGIANDEE